MSQFTGKGINPKTNREVSILYGYDSVPGFRAGYFFQVYLLVEDPDWNEDKENCILNKGMLNGLTEKELKDLKKKYSVKETKPINKKAWIQE